MEGERVEQGWGDAWCLFSRLTNTTSRLLEKALSFPLLAQGPVSWIC